MPTEQLSSAQYLPAEYIEDPQPENSGPAAVAQAAAANRLQERPVGIHELPAFKKLASDGTGVLIFITAALAILGIVGVLGGGWAIAEWATIDQAETAEVLSQLPQMQQELFHRVIDAQQKYKLVVFFNMGLRVLIGIGFVASCIFLWKNRTNANSFAAMCCIAAIFYNISIVVTTWLITPSFEGIGNLPSQISSFVGAFGIGLVAVFAFCKIGLYAFFAAYLSKKNIAALFEDEDETKEEATPASVAV